VAYDLTDRLDVARVTESSVRTFVAAMLTGLGANEDETRINTDGITTACLWWHPGQGQGLRKLFRYARRMRNGGIVPDAPMRWAAERTSTALLDAAKGLGYVSAHRAMAKAIEKARGSGIAMVGVQHSNHFGIAGYHAKQAADAGMIGVAMTNAGAEMAPWGSAEPVLGTNPWGLSVPRSGSHLPIVLDMALTMSGKGMMGWFQREGLPIPDSWALTPEGHTTTNPTEAMDGPLLPIGAYKGYGLSLITDVLTGVLTGSMFGADVFQDDTNFDVAHTMIAIDPEAFMDRALFDERLERLLSDVVSARPIDPGRPVQLPGEAEQRRAEERRRHGIPVDKVNFEELRVLASEIGVPFTLEPVEPSP
jgi:LDH2 family malate/lactate/ureidoglycolate dehydrogenase